MIYNQTHTYIVCNTRLIKPYKLNLKKKDYFSKLNELKIIKGYHSPGIGMIQIVYIVNH